MAYDPGALEATLAAVAGAQPTLIAELRQAFFDSADAHVLQMKATTDPEIRAQSAERLRSLAASFGLQRVMDAARDAAAMPCDDPRAVQRIERALDSLRP